MAINTLFIANRGEIAVRIIKAAKALGGLHLAVLDMEAVQSGQLHTRWLEEWLERGSVAAC